MSDFVVGRASTAKATLPVIPRGITKHLPRPPPRSRPETKAQGQRIFGADKADVSVDVAATWPGEKKFEGEFTKESDAILFRDCLKLFISLREAAGPSKLTLELRDEAKVRWRCSSGDAAFHAPDLLDRKEAALSHRTPPTLGAFLGTEATDLPPPLVPAVSVHPLVPAGEEDQCLVQHTGQSVVLSPEDVANVQERTRKVFQKMQNAHRKEVAKWKKRAQGYQQTILAQQEGGSDYARLLRESSVLELRLKEAEAKLSRQAEDFEPLRERNVELEAKIKELTEQLWDQNHVQKVDWSEAPTLVDFIVIDDRGDQHIVRDIYEYIRKLKENNNDLLKKNDDLHAQLTTKELLEPEKPEAVQRVSAVVAGANSSGAAPDAESDSSPGSIDTPHDTLLRYKETFVGMGTSPTVPVYLRYHGYLQNRCLELKELRDMLADIWKTRYSSLAVPPVSPFHKNLFQPLSKPGVKRNGSANGAVVVPDREHLYPDVDYNNIFVRDSSGSKDTSFAEHFLSHLQQMHAEKTEVFSIAYSIVDACMRFRGYPEVDMFLSILWGEVPEETFFDQMAMLFKFKHALARVEEVMLQEEHEGKGAKEDKSKPKGVITVGHFWKCLESFFPCKSFAGMALLKQALTADMDNPDLRISRKKKSKGKSIEQPIRYSMLFEPGYEGQFVEKLKAQHLQEVLLYLVEVRDSILNIPEKGTLKMVRDTLQKVDSKKPLRHVETTVALALGSKVDQVSWNAQIKDAVPNREGSMAGATLGTSLSHVFQRRCTPREAGRRMSEFVTSENKGLTTDDVLAQSPILAAAHLSMNQDNIPELSEIPELHLPPTKIKAPVQV